MPVQIQRIWTVESATIHKTQGGLMVRAKGMANSGGWSQPQLVMLRYKKPPQDGIQDMEFVASPPEGFATQALTPIEVQQTFQLPGWCKGIRVHANQNSVEAAFE